MSRRSAGKLSRREFARSVTIAAVAASIPVQLGAQQTEALTAPAPPKPVVPSSDQREPQLSPVARAEAESKIQNIFRKYSDRLSEEQKADIRKSMLQAQEALEKVRAFPLENRDEPAAVFRPLTGKES